MTQPPPSIRLPWVRAIVALLVTAVGAAAWADTAPAPRRVVVVPLRYAGPPSGASEAALDAYRATLPKVTEEAIAPVMQQVAQWFARETYGAVKLDVDIRPTLALDKPAPGCDVRRIADDAVVALGPSADMGHAARVFITTYSCWQNHGVTAGTTSILWNTFPDSPGKIAHELGHAFGLGHSAVKGNVYGDGYDQMGNIYSTLTHLSAPHKAALGALRPLPCKDAVLRPLERYPDAIACGSYLLEYHDGAVTIYRRTVIASPYGAADSARIAVLQAGDRWTDGAYAFEHGGNGRVSVKAPR